MRKFRSRFCLNVLAALLWVCTLSSGLAGEHRAPSQLALQLEVSLNGSKVGLLGSFTLLVNQRLAAMRQELDSLGLEVPAARGAGLIPLDEVVGLTYRYNSARQTIDLIVSDALLKTREIGPSRQEPIPATDSRLIGAVINYGFIGSLYDSGGTSGSKTLPFLPQQLQSLSLDTRLFGPLGTFANSGFLGSWDADRELFVRLDSTWSLADPDTLRSWRVGDVITRSPLWARSIRLGGAQVQTDFGLRPDLVTAPLPAFRGSAALPSAVDVFINNTLAYSQQVQPGPFVISNLPTVTGAGSANIVVRDATGRESVQTVSFYGAPMLLRGGLFDFSVEAGFVRENYGVISNDYDGRPVGSGSVRYGLTNEITLEGHGEVGAGLVNVGAGTTFSLLKGSLWSFAVSGSSYDGEAGAQVYAAVQTQVGPATLRLSTQRTIGDYKDLAAVVRPGSATTASSAPGLLMANLDLPKALDMATVSFALPERSGSISLSVINRMTDDQSSRIVAGSYSRPLIGNSSAVVSGFHEFETRNTGFFVGLSIPLGELGHGHLGLSHNGGQTQAIADYAKVASQEPGSVGWRISDSEGEVPVRSAAVTYQGSVARVETGVDQVANSLRGRIMVDGAVVVTSKGTFLSNRVNDAFAVVDVGAPGVDVQVENCKVATTNADGVALVPGLRSYQRNKIVIDPDKLQPDVIAPEVTSQAVPRDRSGVVVNLKAIRTTDSAVVVFRGADGKFIPAGAVGVVVRTGRSFIVGYDGRAFIEALDYDNVVRIDAAGKSCAASFVFREQPGIQPLIDGVRCQ